jgi:hypothetical protein
MVLAPIRKGHESELQHLLASMNHAPGVLNPENSMIRFHEFTTLHFARFLILDDKTTSDISVYDMPAGVYPLALAFVGDVDGNADVFLDEIARRAPQGLKTIFEQCEGFSAADLAGWMKAHNVPAAASYVNRPGRTVQQVREEATLHDAVQRYVDEDPQALKGLSPRHIHATLRRRMRADVDAGRLALSSENPTPVGWQIKNILHLVGVPALVILLAPLLAIIALVAIIQLRRLEKTDPELCGRCDPALADGLSVLEDHDVTNQFSAMGTLKPGLVRLAATMVALLGIDYAARHVFKHGGLGRVRSIHFARWVFLNDRRRVIFMSNYDGSLESYMDDFINKVGFGLNLVFSNGVGYPRTNWLLLQGCRDERKFKEYLRRHQMPTAVWYKAYPGLTAVDLERNSRIRAGLEATNLSEAEARQWVGLL